ncbi:hypothetical protein BDP27DRAFT_1406759 [Rhodocollybia butyracea]|uniref:Uncharacterized protein n=1 Tax=Rhodocollybia butyracea TaxID=206335 RepID=A0A9P5PDF2_9AGAR|nr:hypothetical protein BDP27DRAFT_1406759 [Rhodocollybia butyracea]
MYSSFNSLQVFFLLAVTHVASGYRTHDHSTDLAQPHRVPKAFMRSDMPSENIPELDTRDILFNVVSPPVIMPENTMYSHSASSIAYVDGFGFDEAVVVLRFQRDLANSPATLLSNRRPSLANRQIHNADYSSSSSSPPSSLPSSNSTSESSAPPSAPKSNPEPSPKQAEEDGQNGNHHSSHNPSEPSEAHDSPNRSSLGNRRLPRAAAMRRFPSLSESIPPQIDREENDAESNASAVGRRMNSVLGPQDDEKATGDGGEPKDTANDDSNSDAAQQVNRRVSFRFRR